MSWKVCLFLGVGWCLIMFMFFSVLISSIVLECVMFRILVSLVSLRFGLCVIIVIVEKCGGVMFYVCSECMKFL